MPGHNVLCGAARRGGQGFINAVGEFLLLYRIFPSFPHAREKSGMSREKPVLSPGKILSQMPDLWAWAGREGWAGMAGRQGWGLGPGRARRTCMFLHKNKRRNRLECRFGAVCREKNPVFFTGFFSGGTGFSPRCTGLFKIDGKIRYYVL